MCCFISAVETQLLASVLNLTCFIFMIKTIAHPSMLLLNELFLKENFKTFFSALSNTPYFMCRKVAAVHHDGSSRVDGISTLRQPGPPV